jgi:twitching motility protein PilT
MEEKLHEILRTALKFKASDVHLKVGVPPIVRVDGKLHPLKKVSRLDPMDLETFADVMTNSAQKKRLKEFHELDLGYGVSGLGRFRVNIYSQRGTLVIAMRVITSEILDFKALNMPPVVEKMIAEQRRGLILVTGVTGSGKTTTLAAMIDYINRHRSENIITIEDPIEYLHTDRLSLINQREIGFDTTSFSLALRAALRQDPDVLLVGEMRDLETIALAITAAEVGLLVFGTLHTSSAAKTVDRIIDVFPKDQQDQIRTMLSESLKGVIAQQLLKRADGQGRIAALEILIGTQAVGNLIREGKTYQIPSLIQTGRKIGMQSLDQHLKELLEAELISREEALAYAADKGSIP